jgi:hypothetical protein
MKTQPKHIKAEPSKDINNRSPGVVSIFNMPTRGDCGAFILQINIIMIAKAIDAKKIAVGSVHPIHDKSITPSLMRNLWRYDFAQSI